jgi:hypothetical protein
LLGGLDVPQVGAVELLIVSPMAPLHPTVVLLAALGIPAQGALERLQEALLQGLEALGVVAPKLLTPVGLEGDGRFHPVEAQPAEDKAQEGEAIGESPGVAVGQEAEAGAALTGCPLVAREAAFAEVVPEGRAQSPLVQDVFDVDLEEGEGDLHLPGPRGGVEGFAALFLGWDEMAAAEDVADGIGRDLHAVLLLEVPGQA